tara:strand:- start:722 stop:880 length:159 start_codon:yes stop_codon:yes gene_type:complete
MTSSKVIWVLQLEAVTSTLAALDADNAALISLLVLGGVFFAIFYISPINILL